MALLALAATGCGEARQPPTSSSGDITSNLCTTCHGDSTRQTTIDLLKAAPPRSVKGNTQPTQQGVGAHQIHLGGSGVAAPIPCTTCHVVPDPNGNWESHITGRATLTFSGVAVADGVMPTFDADTATCSNVYCHGATVGGGSKRTPVWTEPWNVDFAAPANATVCGNCHGFPPPFPHPSQQACWNCHSKTVKPDGTIDVAGGRHLDGVRPAGDCGSCHDVPPNSGAHRRHYGDVSTPPLAQYGNLRTLETFAVGGKPYYMFECGNCHPRDPSKHGNGQIDVELADASAPQGSVKAKHSPSAAYDRSTGTCSGVYCHSSGQQTPTYATTPAWQGGHITTCNACHRNPPNYRSDPSTAATNTHVVVGDDGILRGHFRGVRRRHGPDPDVHGLGTPPPGGSFVRPNADSAPITCQTCHYATVDPANAGPSGFYYLDTSGTYAAPNATGTIVAEADACTRCHRDGQQPTAAGRIQPLKHVNGTRDVVFDPRVAAPTSYPSLLAPGNGPTRAYWSSVMDPALVKTFAAQGSDPNANGTTWSLDLTRARYAPETKTCSSVACHLDGSPVWGSPNVGGGGSCTRCHAFTTP